MTTTVKINEADKAKLERLQAIATLVLGSKVTQQELLATIIEGALSEGEGFVASAFGVKLPIPDKQYKRILELIEDWGIETRSEEIDEFLYGANVSKFRVKK